MNTYKITFDFPPGGKVSFFHKPTFDAILFYAVVKEALGDDFTQKTYLENGEAQKLYPKMPIEQKDGVFQASFAFWSGDFVETSSSYKKRFNMKHSHIIDFGKKNREVSITRGEFKSVNNPLPLLAVSQLWFFFRSDNVAEVERLISEYITGIGKKISIGYGGFERFSIEPIPDNPFETSIIRPMPVAPESVAALLKAGTKLQMHGYRPPYWLPENQSFCFLAWILVLFVCLFLQLIEM